MESGSVQKPVGAHVADLVNDPEYRLRETIKNGLDTGILRLEITYYSKQDKMPTLQQVQKHIEYVKNIINKAPNNAYFYCKIEDQHAAYCNCIADNLIIYNYTDKQLLLTRSINTLSYKSNGIYKNRIEQSKVPHVLSNITLNKYIRLFLIEYIPKRCNTKTTTTT